MSLHRILILLAGALVASSVLLALGTFVPDLPYVGTLGSHVLPPLSAQFVIVSLGGAAGGYFARRLGARRLGTLIVVLGLLGAASSGAVLVRHLQVAARNGAHVSIFTAFRLRVSATLPDATATYAHVEGTDLKIDIFRARNPSTSLAPVVIYTHGGGWIEGARTAQAASLRWFADHGFLAVSPDYVLATPGRPTWNTAGAQVACAMKWVAENAATYGGDPDRLFAFGESAGGALTLTATYAAAAGHAVSACGGQVPRVRAVAAMYPAVDPVGFFDNPDPLLRANARRMVSLYLGGAPSEYPDRARAVSSATYITPGAPPTLIFLSDNDHMVPIEGALAFIGRALRAGVAVRTVRFPWADHTLNLQFYSVPNQAMLEIMREHFCRNGGGCAPEVSRGGAAVPRR